MIKVNESIEITKEQYNYIMYTNLSGSCFGRKDLDNKKYYIKVSAVCYLEEVLKYLNK